MDSRVSQSRKEADEAKQERLVKTVCDFARDCVHSPLSLFLPVAKNGKKFKSELLNDGTTLGTLKKSKLRVHGKDKRVLLRDDAPWAKVTEYHSHGEVKPQLLPIADFEQKADGTWQDSSRKKKAEVSAGLAMRLQQRAREAAESEEAAVRESKRRQTEADQRKEAMARYLATKKGALKRKWYDLDRRQGEKKAYVEKMTGEKVDPSHLLSETRVTEVLTAPGARFCEMCGVECEPDCFHTIDCVDASQLYGALLEQVHADGSVTTRPNLCVICWPCNRGKGTQDPCTNHRFNKHRGQCMEYLVGCLTPPTSQYIKDLGLAKTPYPAKLPDDMEAEAERLLKAFSGAPSDPATNKNIMAHLNTMRQRFPTPSDKPKPLQDRSFAKWESTTLHSNKTFPNVTGGMTYTIYNSLKLLPCTVCGFQHAASLDRVVTGENGGRCDPENIVKLDWDCNVHRGTLSVGVWMVLCLRQMHHADALMAADAGLRVKYEPRKHNKNKRLKKKKRTPSTAASTSTPSTASSDQESIDEEAVEWHEYHISSTTVSATWTRRKT